MTIQKDIETIQKLLEKHGMSAIIDVPNHEICVEFNSELGRYKIMNHAKTESLLDDILAKEKAKDWFFDMSLDSIDNKEKIKGRTYIG